MQKRFLLIIIAIFTLTMAPAQTKKPAKKQTTTAKTTASKKKSTSTKTTSTKKKAAPAKKSTNSVEGLKDERARIKKDIEKQEKALKANQADVSKRLKNLQALNTQIAVRKKNIAVIESDISQLDDNISMLVTQMETLQQQLDDRKKKYVKSLRYMARNHSIQDQLMFIFSAHNFAQMYRRMRFAKEYASYQRAQGEALKEKQMQIDEKQRQLEAAKHQKNVLLDRGVKERDELQGQQNEQQKVVNSLQKQQKTIQTVIAQQKKKDAELQKKIDQMIAEEVARAKARAAAEAKKKAEAEAAAKRKAEELARKKAAAEAAERENQRRIAEAKEKEERLKKAAAESSGKAKEEAEQKAREAESDRIAAERKASADKERNNKEVAKAQRSADDAANYSANDRLVSGGFEKNKGRMPMPIAGGRIITHFGQYNVDGLKNVTLDNKGINIQGSSGCQVRAIYDGEVSAVFAFGGQRVVMVRHGSYISVYCNMQSVAVSKGQKVSARQGLGSVGPEGVLHFQLCRETAKLNPESWLAR